MSRQSVFTIREPNIDRVHDKLEYITRSYHIDEMNTIYSGMEIIVIIIATPDERTY